MKLSRIQLRKLIAESYGDMNEPNNTDSNPGDVLQDMPNAGAANDNFQKLKSMVNGDPSMQTIRQAIGMASDLNLDIEQLKSDLAPAFIKIVQAGNTLDSTDASNIIDPIDDNLFRARDLGLKALGVKGVDELQASGELTEDQIYDIDMELIFSVKDKAREAIERAIAQVFAATLK